MVRLSDGFRGTAVFRARSKSHLRLAGFTIEGSRSWHAHPQYLPPWNVSFAEFYTRNGIVVEGGRDITLEKLHIVNIADWSGRRPYANYIPYCVSKAGLSMVTQLFALRLANHGVRVYEVRPGIIDTDMTAGGKERYTKMIAEGLTPIRRWGTPADVGRAVAALVAGAIPFSTGEVLNVDGGFHLRGFP